MKAAEVKALQERRERGEHLELTRFDTGEMLEPVAEVEARYSGGNRKTGVIEFENDESCPILSVSAFPSSIHDDTVVLQVDTLGLVDDKLMIVLNDGPALCHFNPEVEGPPMVELTNFVAAQMRRIPFGLEPADALANIAEHLGFPVLRDGNGSAVVITDLSTPVSED